MIKTIVLTISCALGLSAQIGELQIPVGATAMRLQLHLTDANPKISGATLPYVIQEVLGFEYQYSDTPISFARQLREASTGDPVPGILATQGVGGWILLNGFYYPNEFAVKLVSLLTKDGQPFGARVTHLRFISY